MTAYLLISLFMRETKLSVYVLVLCTPAREISSWEGQILYQISSSLGKGPTRCSKLLPGIPHPKTQGSFAACLWTWERCWFVPIYSSSCWTMLGRITIDILQDSRLFQWSLKMWNTVAVWGKTSPFCCSVTYKLQTSTFCSNDSQIIAVAVIKTV